MQMVSCYIYFVKDVHKTTDDINPQVIWTHSIRFDTLYMMHANCDDCIEMSLLTFGEIASTNKAYQRK